jgi:hypothetical protein
MAEIESPEFNQLLTKNMPKNMPDQERSPVPTRLGETAEIRRYYKTNWALIQFDIKDLGMEAALKKWGLRPQNYSRMVNKRGGVPYVKHHKEPKQVNINASTRIGTIGKKLAESGVRPVFTTEAIPKSECPQCPFYDKFVRLQSEYKGYRQAVQDCHGGK